MTKKLDISLTVKQWRSGTWFVTMRIESAKFNGYRGQEIGSTRDGAVMGAWRDIKAVISNALNMDDWLEISDRNALKDALVDLSNLTKLELGIS